MEYIFGHRKYDGKQVEYVRLSDPNKFQELPEGYFTTYVYSTEAMTVKHTFRVIRKYKEQQDLQNQFLVWYYIDNHTVETDRTAPINTTLSTHSDQLQEQSAAIDDIIISILGE